MLLRETYKTYEGARKRAAFENGLAKSEYEHGYKAKLYAYRIVPNQTASTDITWRIERYIPAFV